MNPKLRKLWRQVAALIGEVQYRLDRLHANPTPGWEYQRLILRRAIDSGYLARFSDEPNYTRLLLARDELRAVVTW